MIKTWDEELIEGSGEMVDGHKNQCVILMEKGYQGFACDISANNPIKRYIVLWITQNRQHNQKIANDRIIVENYFGLETQLQRSLVELSTLSEKVYKIVTVVRRFLTNYHITRHALRDKGNACFQQQRRGMYKDSTKRDVKRKPTCKSYCCQHQRRLNEVVRSG